MLEPTAQPLVTKKPYTKPQIQEIHLRTTETMGITCQKPSNEGQSADDCSALSGCQV